MKCTAIYVHAPTTVTISSPHAVDHDARICRYDLSYVTRALGTHELVPGIYSVTYERAVEVDFKTVTIVVTNGDKDTWPDPKPNVIALEPGANAATVRSFVEIAKDESPGH